MGEGSEYGDSEGAGKLKVGTLFMVTGEKQKSGNDESPGCAQPRLARAPITATPAVLPHLAWFSRVSCTATDNPAAYHIATRT